MNKTLSKLQQVLPAYSPSSLHCVSVFKCYKLQQLHRVPFYQPTLLMVIKGHKEVLTAKITVNSGELVLVPADTSLRMNQNPDTKDNQYFAMALRFDYEAIKHFRLIYGSSIDDWDISPKWHGKASEKIISSLLQWVNWEDNDSGNTQLIQLRQVELLLLLAQEGLLGNILLSEHPSWKHRVTQLLYFDPARSWKIADVCSQLAVSESSLRRKLQLEETTFRDLLEEVRLVTGLTLLSETQDSIALVSVSVGYKSQSRFGERFKLRFGLTPTELRTTLNFDV